MKYQQKTFSVSMPGGSCAWPFQPRELACRPGWAYRFWLQVSLAEALWELQSAIDAAIEKERQDALDEAAEEELCPSR